MHDLKGINPIANPGFTPSLIADDADLTKQPLAFLEAEIARLESLVSLDRDTANKFAALSRKLTADNAALERLEERLTDCEGAKMRITALRQEREESYKRVFEAIVAEESVLRDLYKPLMTRLGRELSTLGKLAFSVSREADINHWADAGEHLLDLRRQGPFKGRGTLYQIAEKTLKAAWLTGDPKTASAAMELFLNDNRDALLEHSPVDKSNLLNYREWAKKLAKWLYGTDHISIHYSIDYDGTDIRKLSPGTRGIVLLLLYLALDDADDRPLIIDQPEENLDPKSIFEELVELFLAAKQNRQVILVTHNANLVVNTDADQIIVASVGPHHPGELPPISYMSGGLESAEIRKAVCDILEGGERAFQERARRLRVQLDR
jgi:DNA repair exonuclease SbcCD ATPase subunit